MNEKSFPFTCKTREQRYEFLSISASKTVTKVVLLTSTSVPDICNLALLDLLDDGTLSDVSETRNNDMRTKKENLQPKLTGEQIVQKKLDEVNEMLRKTDLTLLWEHQTKTKNKVG